MADNFEVKEFLGPTFKQGIQRSKTLGEGIKSFNVIVCSIHRYHADPSSLANISASPHHFNFIYDIIVTDGIGKMKCVLSTAWNQCVQKNTIKPGCGLMVLDCDVKYDDTDIDSDSFVVITKFEVFDANKTLNQASLKWHSEASEKEKSLVPLLSSRGSYVPLWHTDDSYGPQWEAVVSPKFRAGGFHLDDAITLQDLKDKMKHPKRPLPPIVVRVLHKDRLHCYAKSDTPNKWPYQAYLEVADSTGVCALTLWNNMCPEFYNSILEGFVLYISNYVLKRGFMRNSKPVLRAKNLARFDGFEISVNKHHPSCDLRIVHPSCIQAEWNLPDIKYNFITRRQLSSMPSDSNIDVCGVITFLSRPVRLKKTRKGSSCEADFWVMRWLHLHDSTSPLPMIVQVFNTSQPSVTSRLAPGQMLVCTQMRVIHETKNLQTSHGTRALYVTTTNQSQLYTTGDHHRGDYMQCSAIKTLVRWCQTNVATEHVAMATMGGYYDYPQLPLTLGEYKALFEEVKITSGGNLKAELDTLYFKEHKRLTVQGCVVCVKYFKLSSNPAPDPKVSPIAHRLRGSQQEIRHARPKKKRKKDEPQEICVSSTWPDVKAHIPMLGIETPHPCTLPVQFSEEYKDVIKRHMDFPPVCLGNRQQIGPKNLPKPVPEHCLLVTLTDLNQQVALNTIVILSNDVSHDATLEHVICGQERITNERNVENDDAGTSAGPTRNTRTSRTLHRNGIDSILRSSTALAGRRLVCVLDLYGCGGDDCEIILNRAYVT